MRIDWHIDDDDVSKVKAFLAEHGNNAFVRYRIEMNLSESKEPVTQDVFWACMIGCLLTTQQRSGPTSAVSRFIATKPFPLDFQTCAEQDELASFVTSILSKFGGLRRSTLIGKEVEINMSFLKDDGWDQTSEQLESVRLNPTSETERLAARFIDDHFHGFGPKQSRNLLQGLGLSRFEIPIDSRITKWLNDFGFPVRLTANPLGDQNYYEFISDGFQRLCEACGVAPCVLDAAIFSSFDQGGWTEENVVW